MSDLTNNIEKTLDKWSELLRPFFLITTMIAIIGIFLLVKKQYDIEFILLDWFLIITSGLYVVLELLKFFVQVKSN